jgi:STE24 endopeptidase
MVLLIVLVLIVLRLAVELWLSALNRAEVRRHAETPPPSVAATMDPATYRKAVAYTLVKSRFGNAARVFDAVVLALVLVSGVLVWLYSLTSAWSVSGTWNDVLFILFAAILVALPGLPFDWWSQFRLEERFGFNRSTPRLWVTDKLKGLALLLVIGFPLLWGLLSLVELAGATWWIWGFTAFFAFQLLMIVLFPKLILPLFNKLSPLPPGDLRDRLMALAERTGFRASTIEVMDGSKRSGHSNAFFTGFGRYRRIVLYDTLVSQLSPEELEAVLAHEVGHYKKGHIPKMLALSAVMQFAAFGAIAWLARTPWFNVGFGFPPGELGPTLLLFALLSGVVTFWFSPLGHLLSRKYEFEADRFAREAVGRAGPLVAALRALARENLSNLTPHPWFSGFYYSHPTLVERERALEATTPTPRRGSPESSGRRASTRG